MQFLDFSPPSHPTLEQQKDALQKGLGRAFQWAQQGLLREEILLEACLRDQRFDKQCEGNRGDFLWDIISVSGMEKRFRDPIFNALCVDADDGNTWQLCELAYYFAEAGDAGFRQQLYKNVGQRQTSDAPILGEDQLLRLDGADALRFLVGVRGRNLASHDWDWDDSRVIESAIELLGEQRVQELLTESSDPDVRRFASGWQANVKLANDPEPHQTHQQKMERTTVSEVLKAAHSDDRSLWLKSWGTYAKDDELELILKHIWTEQAPGVIVKLLRVFSGRPMPNFEPGLLELCRHSDADVRRCAFKAVGQNSHPSVREFALKELRQPTIDGPVVELLIKNFLRGDEQLLLDQVELPEDLCLRHWMLMDVRNLLEHNAEADSLKLGLISYFHTPCQLCRCYAAQLLVDRKTAPAWLVEECNYDANEECHDLQESDPSEQSVNEED